MPSSSSTLKVVMLKDLNEKIKECRENMALKEIIEKRNLSLENELNSKEKELGELEKSLNKEMLIS